MALTQSKIPPHAYTRDTLVKAIEWLSGQPANVRERANSADLIVSHYLQARRHSAAAQMEAPISQENFKADLRHLAEDLKRFEEPSAPPPQPTRSPTYLDAFLPPVRPAQHVAPPSALPVQPTLPLQPSLPVQPAPVPVAPAAMAPPSPPQAVVVQAPAEAPVRGPIWAIDARSLAVARELQDRLNLSSESEAIRMLVTMGAERARALFPNS